MDLDRACLPVPDSQHTIAHISLAARSRLQKKEGSRPVTTCICHLHHCPIRGARRRRGEQASKHLEFAAASSATALTSSCDTVGRILAGHLEAREYGAHDSMSLNGDGPGREKRRVSRVTYQLVTIRWREGLPISRNGRQASPGPRTQEIGGLISVLFFCGRVHCRADALGLSGWQCGTTVECEQTRVPAVFTLLLHLSLPDVRAHAFGCERPANKGSSRDRISSGRFLGFWPEFWSGGRLSWSRAFIRLVRET
ncbi:hypothetical protein BGZ57DRAFT_859527 [Hyaloscypha finlandica]|nr:hypothetical protein BGZ57DRAFT_859527 [Hyaloscypha finlandica]